MHTALVVTREEPKTARRMSAGEFEAALALNPDLIEQTQAFDLDTGAPTHFRRAHKRFGGEQPVSACFAFAAGYAPDQDHIFGHKRENISVIEAAQRGKKILLSLNADLTNRAVNYRVLRDPLTTNLEDWMAEHRGNYFIQSVKTAEELVVLLRKLHNEVPNYSLKHNLRVLHRGAVMRYQQFFVRANADNFQQLYHTMRDGITGMATDASKTRIIGAPRLVEFEVAQTTLCEKGVRGIRSKSYPDGGLKIFNQLVVRGHTQEPSVLKREWDRISALGRSFYVLAAPVISRAADGWEQIRWIVNDMDAQLAKKGQPSAGYRPPRDSRATGDLFEQFRPGA
jgi:hypothetical protein